MPGSDALAPADDASDRERPLRRLALHCVAFALPLIFLSLFVERGLRTVPTPYAFKKASLEAQAPDIEVLLLGGSSVLHGIRPDIMRERSFNAGYNWQSIWYDEEYVSRYLSSLPRLKMVIVGLHYMDLKYRMPDGAESSFHQFLYSRFQGFASEGHIDPLDIRNVSLFSLYGPWDSVDLVRRGFHANLAEGIDGFGWLPLPYTPGLHYEAEVVAQHQALMHDTNLPLNVAILDTMLAALRARGVALALVAMPMSRGYVAAASRSERAAIVSTLRAMEAKGALYEDYFGDARLADEDFCDADHLAVAGATKLSKLIDDEVVGPALGRSFHQTPTGSGDTR